MTLNNCPFCGKTDFKHAGARNLHVMHCELKHLREKGKSGGTGNNIAFVSLECQHSWRMLVSSNPQEQEAIRQGYSKVCEKCEEVVR